MSSSRPTTAPTRIVSGCTEQGSRGATEASVIGL
jgi:hypothetical protein